MAQMKQADYAKLLGFRTELRRFLYWSEQQALAAGLTPSQHQLLLAVKGHGGPDGPTIGEVAASLLLRHHSAVGLADRTEKAGYVERSRDPDDHRVIRLQLTPKGELLIGKLSQAHLEELRRFKRLALP
jgi:DNA-binding MarR family transcriptional regulator